MGYAVFVLQDVLCIMLLSAVIGRRAMAQRGWGEEGRRGDGAREENPQRKMGWTEAPKSSTASPFPPVVPPALPELAVPPPTATFEAENS